MADVYRALNKSNNSELMNYKGTDFINELGDFLNKLDKLRQVDDFEFVKNMDYAAHYDFGTLKDMANKLPKSLEEVYELFDPKINNVRRANYKDFVNMKDVEGSEVWTDSKCILVDNNLATKLKKMDKN